jgi:hypothetical protein
MLTPISICPHNVEEQKERSMKSNVRDRGSQATDGLQEIH